MRLNFYEPYPPLRRGGGEAKIVSRTIPPQAEGLIPRPLVGRSATADEEFGSRACSAAAEGFIPVISTLLFIDFPVEDSIIFERVNDHHFILTATLTGINYAGIKTESMKGKIL